MHHNYADIRERIAEPPKWWDEYAVPRYCDFHPSHAADIYATEIVLLGIECQSCAARFKVCMSWSSVYRNAEGKFVPHEPLTAETLHHLHYGDPPNAECCGAGATMNSIPRRVLQFWRRGSPFDWERVPELEVPIDCDWWDDE